MNLNKKILNFKNLSSIFVVLALLVSFLPAATSANSTAVETPVLYADPQDGAVQLTWEDVEGAYVYLIYRSDAVDGTYQLIEILDTTFTSLLDVNVENGKTYYYKLNVYKFVSSTSEVVSATPNSGEYELGTPVIYADPGNDKVVLAWEDLKEAAVYEIYRAEEVNGTYEFLTTNEVYEGYPTYYSDNNVENGKTYYYKMVVYNGTDSKESAVVSATLESHEVELGTPVIYADPQDGKVILTWEDVEGATTYEIYRAEEVDGTYNMIEVFGTYMTTLHDSNVENGKTYYYKMIAKNETDKKASEVIEVTLESQDKTPIELGTPVLYADPGDGKVALTWKDLEGAAVYEIYRAEEVNGTYEIVTTNEVYGGYPTYYSDNYVENGKTYYYKMVVFNGTDSKASAVVSATLESHEVELGTPVLYADPGDSKVALTWKDLEGAAVYEIYRAEEVNGTYEIVTTNEVYGGQPTYYSDNYAENGKTYYYKMVVFNGTDSKASEVVSATPNSY
ncbi:fibronectin type III domain-containing protein [Longirhabdus pacifica]|uniref:fibronectin type III domain-containing protein n=1 Tax=Longirhabdus pacifica TaxID=2305227 RepID=UPI0010088C31|nr:hypothetical protein [Longirhabdus pacifica]